MESSSELAVFPDNLASRELTYTVLESTPSSLFVDVSGSASYERLAGTMLSSSSDGTQFSIVLQRTSRHGWIVDFERVQSTKEILLANILTNPVEASMGAPKRRRTLISFDNGAEWLPIPAPPLDVNGNRIGLSWRLLASSSQCCVSTSDQLFVQRRVCTGAVGCRREHGRVSVGLRGCKDVRQSRCRSHVARSATRTVSS